MRISVALATHQGEKFLRGQLDSLASQTRPPDEVIVRDDGSSDKTVDILESFASEVPFPVKTEASDQQLGSTMNFEQIFALCSGDVIVTCDQDDIWLPTKLARFENTFVASGASLVFSDAYLIQADGLRRRRTFWQVIGFTKEQQERLAADPLPMLISRATVSGCTMAVRSDDPLIFPFPPDPDPNGLRMPHDRWISLVAAATGKLCAIAEPLVEYRLHNEQQIGVSYLRIRSVVPSRLLRWRLATLKRHEVLQRMESMRHYLGLIEERVKTRLDDPQRSEALDRVAYCQEHVEFRRTLNEARTQRVGPVIAEARSGRYQRCSLGLPSVVADLTRK